MLTLDTVGRISGVMEYDPGGLVNRATYWDDMTNTPHQGCWWVGYGMKVAAGGLAPLRSQLRARMPRVDQSTNSCVGQFKLSAAGVWTQEPNNHWECGPKSHTVMPWVSMADNDLVALKYCSWDGAPVNPQPLGISVEGFEYRKFEEGATPYIVPLRFPGQYFDEETEFHENWNRYYDPSTGRYLSPEPLLQDPSWVASELQAGHQVPAYSYARNNPVRYVDPDGLRAYALWCPPVQGIERGFTYGRQPGTVGGGRPYGFYRTPGSVSFDNSANAAGTDSACDDYRLASALDITYAPATFLAGDCWRALVEDIRLECEAEKRRGGPKRKRDYVGGELCSP